MSWVRIHDGAMTHPKIHRLSDKAFRLWVWGLAYCQAYLTDGAIERSAIPARLKRAAEELIAATLWIVEGAQFQVHDYLDWNDDKATVVRKRTFAKERMQNVRSRTPPRGVPSGLCISGSFQEKGCGEKPAADDLAERAGRLREELYPAWYAKYRHGARLRLVANSLEYQDALSLVQTWDDARLEKLARIVLTTDDPFIAGTDRSFRIFAMKVSWADDRLKQAENGAA